MGVLSFFFSDNSPNRVSGLIYLYSTLLRFEEDEFYFAFDLPNHPRQVMRELFRSLFQSLRGADCNDDFILRKLSSVLKEHIFDVEAPPEAARIGAFATCAISAITLER